MIDQEKIEETIQRDLRQATGLTMDQMEERIRLLLRRSGLDPDAVERVWNNTAMASVELPLCCHFHTSLAVARSTFCLALQLMEDHGKNTGTA